MAKNAFYATLSAAIRDLTIHGFDSRERLESWLQQLSHAARQALVPEHVLVSSLRDSLTRIYHRTVDKPEMLLKRHQGISLFTLQRIKPSLHAELDRRILASASLIKLNRDASIQKTLQRFAGWASSIPAGGSRAVDRRETADDVRRGIAGLSFEDRRVVIDQGHKLVAAINDIVARDGGAIAGIWEHVHEGAGYQARPEHVARDGQLFVVRDCWALRDGLMKTVAHAYTDAVDQPAEKPFCRCRWRFVYNLRDLPAEMLTEKGRQALQAARAA